MSSGAGLLAEAQRAFAGGDPAQAVRLLDRLPPALGRSPDLLQFRAMALKRAGRVEEARDALAAAHRAAPADPEIANNYANLLKGAGALDQALALYDRAIAARPGYRDACFNRALTLQSLGRVDEALAEMDALLAAAPRDARVQSARGTMLLALGRPDQAAAAFDAALASGQSLPTAMKGRARVALERGEADAVARFQQAAAAAPGDPELVLGLADGLEADGDAAGMDLLATTVASNPDWIAGLERLAAMRAEAGHEDFVAGHRAALEVARDPVAVRRSLAKVLADGERHHEAADVLAPLTEVQDGVARAFSLGEAGRPAEGLSLLDAHTDRGPARDLIVARLAMATGDLDRAGALLERVVTQAPESVSAWAHLELTWRATGDPRGEWLSGQPGLIAARDIGLRVAELAETADLLRRLHRTRAHPIGQSLRGGTQTRGRLLWRTEPAIRRLGEALDAAVAAHVARLPPADRDHPLLRPRDASFAIAGSWSVRLTQSGFHVHHIHPEGVLSSACYLAVPTEVTGSPNNEGWLELGRPPAALNLALKPRAVIEPAPGRLVLFPSYLYHGTRPFAAGERLTVAFDVVAA